MNRILNFVAMNKRQQPKMDEEILRFLFNLSFHGKLPKNIGLMNPFLDSTIREISGAFYRKFYHDHKKRHLILGINPGRLGAGATGIPFTDTKRLETICGLQNPGFQTHEPSSVFIYAMIEAYGGAEKFYSDFYISSVSPLGFVMQEQNKQINYNYYDSVALAKSVRPFAIQCLKEQLSMNISRDAVFVLGTGKNAQFVESLNSEFGFFQQVIAFEHPRYIMQYKAKNLQSYITKYLQTFSGFIDQ